jgi:hypothetical protein
MMDGHGYNLIKGEQAGIIIDAYCDNFDSLSYPDLAECGGNFQEGEDKVEVVGGSTYVFVHQIDGQLGITSKDGMPEYNARLWRLFHRGGTLRGRNPNRFAGQLRPSPGLALGY